MPVREGPWRPLDSAVTAEGRQMAQTRLVYLWLPVLPFLWKVKYSICAGDEPSASPRLRVQAI